MRNIDAYEAAVAAARARFTSAGSVRWLFSGQPQPEEFERFLLHYSALGAAMTQPLAGWTRRAGQRCLAIGFDRLGTALRDAARVNESGHALLLADLGRLCARRTTERGVALTPEEVLRSADGAVTQRFRALHEDVVEGPTPYAAVAIQHEFEIVGLDWGTQVLDSCVRLLGAEVADMLAFLREHESVEHGYAVFSRERLVEFLEDRPGAVLPLGCAGAAALEVYQACVDECVRRARAADVLIG